MKKLLSLGLVCSALSLIGMDQPRELTLDEASQLLYQGCPTIFKSDALKSKGGIAALYVLHKSGKPFSKHAFVTTLGIRVEEGNAEDFHRMMSNVSFKSELAVKAPTHPSMFICDFARVIRIEQSCYTRGKELAKEIPAGQTMRWICEPIRVIQGCLMPEIDKAEQARIIRWAQESNVFSSDKLEEKDLVSLDQFADWDGKKIYPQGWVSIEEKMERFKQAEQRNTQTAGNEKLEELDL